ncbi:MAG: polyphosphate polymerase domain-containing protein [Bacteroidetes bacterium]|nr:polyphosphate polymerase domain-containing protein [Bacteroidota bacterium]
MLRYELKYIIPNERLLEVRARLKPFLEYDNYARKNKGEYTVRSIYFDTPNFECYTTKVAGIKNRNKIRIRGYNEEGPENAVFFEIKKKFEHPIHKHRSLSTFNEMQDVFEQGSVEGRDVDLNRFLYHVYSRRMKPVVTVIYEREAYEAPTADVNNRLRITFDKNLRAMPYPTLDELYNEQGAVYALPGHFILEVKFNHFMPGWLSELLHSLNIKRVSASKYCLSIDALEEVDPNAKFHTLIHSRFSPEESF